MGNSSGQSSLQRHYSGLRDDPHSAHHLLSNAEHGSQGTISSSVNGSDSTSSTTITSALVSSTVSSVTHQSGILSRGREIQFSSPQAFYTSVSTKSTAYSNLSSPVSTAAGWRPLVHAVDGDEEDDERVNSIQRHSTIPVEGMKPLVSMDIDQPAAEQDVVLDGQEQSSHAANFQPEHLIGCEVQVTNLGIGLIVQYLQSIDGALYYILQMKDGRRVVVPIQPTTLLPSQLGSASRTTVLNRLY